MLCLIIKMISRTCLRPREIPVDLAIFGWDYSSKSLKKISPDVTAQTFIGDLWFWELSQQTPHLNHAALHLSNMKCFQTPLNQSPLHSGLFLELVWSGEWI